MHGLIALYIGYTIYLAIFFCFPKRDFLSKKITIFLGVKLAALTLIYFLFFGEKLTHIQREANIKEIIIN